MGRDNYFETQICDLRLIKKRVDSALSFFEEKNKAIRTRRERITDVVNDPLFLESSDVVSIFHNRDDE